MEQLQPILKHKFWILFGLALVFPIVGWFVATGAATSEIDERIAKIQGTNVSSGANAPNDQWIQSLEQVNEREGELLDSAAAYLWRQQKRLMVWPAAIRDRVGQLNYRDPIPDQALNFYVRLYPAEHQRAQQVVKPYDFETDEGLVALRGELPFRSNYSQWVQRGTLSSSEEMWDAQEDIWLLRALLHSVARTNQQADAKSITEAPVRQIDRIAFMGGSRPTEGGAAGPAASGFGGEDMPGGMEDYMGDMEGDYGMPDQGGGAGGVANVGFDPAEEFGPAGGGAMGGGMMMGSAMGGHSADADDMGLGGNGGMARMQPRRYVDDEDVPFRTRGFYMEVVMDHTKLPELLGELISSPWPVEIVRVQQGEAGSSGGGGGGYGYGGSGGMGGGMMGLGLGGGAPGMGPARGFGGGARNPFAGGGARNPFASGGRQAPGGPFNRQRPGTTGPIRPGPMGQGPMNPMQQAGTRRRGGEKFQTAMQDPILARVAIAGLMTLFENPAAQQTADTTAGTTAAGAGAETAPAANGTVSPDATLDPAPVYPDALDATDSEPPVMLDDDPAEFDPAAPALDPAEALPEADADPADQPLPPVDEAAPLDDAAPLEGPPALPDELEGPAAAEPAVPNG